MILALAVSLALSTEALIIFSNLIVALSTLLLFWASLREQHTTVREIIKANSRLVKRLVGRGDPK